MIPPLPQLERCGQCKVAPSIGLLFFEGVLGIPRAVKKLRRQWIPICPGVQEQLDKPKRVPICVGCLGTFRALHTAGLQREIEARYQREQAASIAALPSITPQTVTEQFGDSFGVEWEQS